MNPLGLMRTKTESVVNDRRVWGELAKLARTNDYSWEAITGVLDTMLNRNGVGLWWHVVATGTSYWSDAIYEIFGLERSVNVDPAYFTREFVHADDKAAMQVAIENFFENGGYDVSYRINRTDGQVRWLHSVGQKLTAQDGSIILAGVTSDQTQLHSVIDSAMQERNQLMSVLSHNAEAIYTVGKDLKISWISEQLQPWAGLGKLIGVPLRNTVPPELSDAADGYVNKVLETGEPLRFDMTLPSVDDSGQPGALRTIRNFYNPYIHADGTRGIIARVIDITDDERERETAQLERQQLIDALARQDVTIHLVDENYTYVWVHNMLPGWEDLMPLEGKCLLDIVPANLRERFKDRLDFVMTTGQETTFYVEIPTLTVEGFAGRPTRLSQTFLPYAYDGGKHGVLGLVQFVSDIAADLNDAKTARKQFRDALNREPLCLFLTDETLDFLWINNLPEGWLHLDEEKVHTMYDLFPHDIGDQLLTALAGVRDTGEALHFEVELPRHDGNGTTIFKAVYSRYLLPNGKHGVMGKVRDVTEQRRNFEKLEISLNRLSDGLKEEPISIYVLDATLHFVWIHNIHPGWVGREIIGTDVRTLVEEAAGKLYSEAVQHVLATDESITRYIYMGPPEGVESYYFRHRFTPYELPDKTMAVLCISTDLSDVKRAELETGRLNEKLQAKVDELAETERRYDVALDASLVTLSIQDENLNYLWIRNLHPAWAGLLKVGDNEYDLLEKGVIAQDFISFKKEVIAGKTTSLEREVQSPRGERYYFKIDYAPYQFADGSRGIQTKTYDLTASKRMEQRQSMLAEAFEKKAIDLTETERRFDSALDGSLITLSIQDENFTYLWVKNVHPEWKNIVVVGANEADNIANGDQWHPHLDPKRRALNGETVFGEGYVEGPTGNKIFARWEFSPYMLTGGKRGVQSKYYDLTELKQTEEKQADLARTLVLERQELEATLARLNVSHKEKLEELERARQTQLSLLPKGSPMPDMLDYAVSLENCIEVGGDYYDYRRQGERLLLAVGDATGHGLHSATVVSMVKAHVQLLAQIMPLDEIMTKISDSLVELNLQRMYMGLILLEMMPGGFNYTAAGMPPVLVYRKASGEIQHYLQRGLFLGTSLRQPTAPVFIPMAEGDVLLAMSDGLPESANRAGVMISQAVMEEVFAKAAPSGSHAVIDAMRALQASYLNGRQIRDDITLMALRLL